MIHEHVLKLKGQRVACTIAVCLYTVPPLLQDFHQFCQHLTLEQVEAAFSKFDISGDEELDYREFCSMMNAKKSVITGITVIISQAKIAKILTFKLINLSSYSIEFFCGILKFRFLWE